MPGAADAGGDSSFSTEAVARGLPVRLPLQVPFDFVAVNVPTPPVGGYLRVDSNGQWKIFDVKGEPIYVPPNAPKRIDFNKARVPVPAENTFMQVVAYGIWTISRVSDWSLVEMFKGTVSLNQSYDDSTGDPPVIVAGNIAPNPPLGGWVTLNPDGDFHVYRADGKLVNPQPNTVPAGDAAKGASTASAATIRANVAALDGNGSTQSASASGSTAVKSSFVTPKKNAPLFTSLPVSNQYSTEISPAQDSEIQLTDLALADYRSWVDKL